MLRVQTHSSTYLRGGRHETDQTLVQIDGDIKAETFLERFYDGKIDLPSCLGETDNLFFLIHAMRMIQRHQARARYHVEMNFHPQSEQLIGFEITHERF